MCVFARKSVVWIDRNFLFLVWSMRIQSIFSSFIFGFRAWRAPWNVSTCRATTHYENEIKRKNDDDDDLWTRCFVLSESVSPHISFICVVLRCDNCLANTHSLDYVTRAKHFWHAYIISILRIFFFFLSFCPTIFFPKKFSIDNLNSNL